MAVSVFHRLFKVNIMFQMGGNNGEVHCREFLESPLLEVHITILNMRGRRMVNQLPRKEENTPRELLLIKQLK